MLETNAILQREGQGVCSVGHTRLCRASQVRRWNITVSETAGDVLDGESKGHLVEGWFQSLWRNFLV
jgi:hypothetical protein